MMRYEDWTFRETEVRLREHRELRETLQLSSVPDYTTLYRFLRRRRDPNLAQAGRPPKTARSVTACAASPAQAWWDYSPVQKVEGTAWSRWVRFQ